ncbi:MAG: ribonuclease H-like domain-containing protein, partial [Deltaproteobacteria bacterium]
MNLEEKLRALKKSAGKPTRDSDLDRQLTYLRRMEEAPKKLPAQRAARGIEHYVDGTVESNFRGEYFSARQLFPFGRPYGKLRIGDISTAELASLGIFLAESTLPEAAKLAYLDTETTGLAGGTGTCAFLIGVGIVEGRQFAVRQFFLRDYPEEKAVLAALAEMLEPFAGVVTFNGKTFDLPLLETRYALARMKSPFARLVHLDLLHPARRLWKLRLDSCKLTHLEKHILGIERQGDVDGAEIPAIYFDYLRTGEARGLQPVFYHNALDIMTLTAL